jgi:hypothetical protein
LKIRHVNVPQTRGWQVTDIESELIVHHFQETRDQGLLLSKCATKELWASPLNMDSHKFSEREMYNSYCGPRRIRDIYYGTQREQFPLKLFHIQVQQYCKTLEIKWFK